MRGFNTPYGRTGTEPRSSFTPNRNRQTLAAPLRLINCGDHFGGGRRIDNWRNNRRTTTEVQRGSLRGNLTPTPRTLSLISSGVTIKPAPATLRRR